MKQLYLDLVDQEVIGLVGIEVGDPPQRQPGQAMARATASGRALMEAGWSTMTSAVPCLVYSFVNKS
ncbi:hypothetical protein I6J40_20140 [Streptomyces californicus]|nr:hypothetical protein I6J40_20140 [Streptomyces californicus]